MDRVPDVDLIARAAMVMRERAERADTDDARRPYGAQHIPPVDPAGWPAMVDNYLGGVIGAHCASWTPGVARAVADWLDTGADLYSCVDRAPMVAVARAYLREPEQGPS